MSAPRVGKTVEAQVLRTYIVLYRDHSNEACDLINRVYLCDRAAVGIVGGTIRGKAMLISPGVGMVNTASAPKR